MVKIKVCGKNKSRLLENNIPTSPVSATLSPDARSCDIPAPSPTATPRGAFAPIKTNALFFFRKRKGFSLRLGHRSALTAIQAVIHSLAAASLRKRKIFLSTRPMRASVVCDSRFTQIRAKVCSPSDIRRCIPIPEAKATTLAARLFRSAFGAKRLRGGVG